MPDTQPGLQCQHSAGSSLAHLAAALAVQHSGSALDHTGRLHLLSPLPAHTSATESTLQPPAQLYSTSHPSPNTAGREPALD